MPRSPSVERIGSVVFECAFCHHESPFIRMVHRLKFPTDNALAGHLREQFGEGIEKDGGIAAAIGWTHMVSRLYAGSVDADGTPLPLWKSYMAAHGKLPRNHREIDEKRRRADEGR